MDLLFTMNSRKKYCYLWILPVLIIHVIPVSNVPVDCTQCTCSLDGDRPTIRCRGKELTTMPTELPPNLVVLDLSNNQISRIEEDDLQMLEDLETLFMENSGVSYIHPRAFRNMFNLRTIFFQANRITMIEATLLQHLPRAIEINFNENDIRFISRYAFLTLTIEEKVRVKLSGNPVHCGCDMLALKHWLLERNSGTRAQLEFDDLKCNNVENLPLLDMNDDNFSCQDEDPTVFEDDLKCRTCQTASSSEQCDRDGTMEECESEEDNNHVCGTTLTYTDNRLTIRKSCNTYDECLRRAQANAVNCTLLHNVHASVHCHFCCVGELCNVTNVGGRVKDYTFYLKLSFRGGVYDHDLSDPNSNKYRALKELVQTAIIEALRGKIDGVFYMTKVTFGAPGLNVYFQLNGRMFVQYDDGLTQTAIKIALNNTLFDVDSKLQRLNISTVHISNQAPMFCLGETQNTSKGTFVWPQAAVTETVSLTCPHNPNNDRMLRQAFRTCSSLLGAAIWQDPNLNGCPFASEMTRRLEDLANIKVTPENVLNVSKRLEKLLSEAVTFNQEDVSFAVDIVRNIVKEGTSIQSREIINMTLASVSFVLGAPSDVLLESEQKKSATTRLLGYVNDISTSVSLANGDLIVVKPNLAVAAIGVDPHNFPGISFTTDSTNSVDGSLAGGQIEIKKGNQSVTGSSKSAIILPDSLFTSLRSRDPSAINRVTFSIYPTDKVFSVFEEARQGPSVNPTGRGASSNNGSAAASVMAPTGDSSAAAAKRGDGLVPGGNSGESTRMINSRVLAATVPNVVVTNLSDPVIIHLPHLRKNADNPKCVYWRESSSTAGWSEDGCRVKEYVKDSYTTCACDHLTNFALLMDVYNGGTTISEEDKLALSIISYIGCGVSLLCLLLTLLTYLMFRKLRRDNPSKILVNLCIALAVANLIFLAGMQDYTFKDPVACKVIAVMLHYFLLSALTWMAVEAFYMYLALVLVFKTYFTNFILKCCVIGWGLPLVVIAVTLGVNSTDNYGLLESGICWIRNPAFYIAFLAPVAIILLLNFAAFGLVLRQLLGLSSRKLNKSDKTSTITQLRGAVGVVILLGLTWVFAVFAIDRASLIFYYLFAITNSLQGLFIFIFYCLFKKDALTAWRRTLPCCEIVDEKSGDRTTSRGYSTPVSNNTVKHTISSANGSSDSNCSNDVKQRGKSGQYQISRDSGFESSESYPVGSRTSTFI